MEMTRQQWQRASLTEPDLFQNPKFQDSKIDEAAKSTMSPLSTLTGSTFAPSSGPDTEEGEGVDPPSPKRARTIAELVRGGNQAEFQVPCQESNNVLLAGRYNTRSSKRLRGRSPTPPPNNSNTSSASARVQAPAKHKDCFRRAKPSRPMFVGFPTPGIFNLATSYGTEINPRTGCIVSWGFPNEEQVRHNLQKTRYNSWAEHLVLRAAVDDEEINTDDVYLLPERKYEDWRYMWTGD
eukprot:Selendium_serpulae@DN2060_c0_g1_i2.p1